MAEMVEFHSLGHLPDIHLVEGFVSEKVDGITIEASVAFVIASLSLFGFPAAPSGRSVHWFCWARRYRSWRLRGPSKNVIVAPLVALSYMEIGFAA
jgi:hypothetical protein